MLLKTYVLWLKMDSLCHLLINNIYIYVICTFIYDPVYLIEYTRHSVVFCSVLAIIGRGRFLSCTVYLKKYAHGFCFAVLYCGYTLTDFPISIRLTSLALWQSNDCPSASKATLMNMDKYFMWIHYERLHNHNKAKHNKTVCIFLGIYCNYPWWHGCLRAREITLKGWYNGASFTKMDLFYSMHGKVISCPVKCGMKLRIHSQTSTRFVNG